MSWRKKPNKKAEKPVSDTAFLRMCGVAPTRIHQGSGKRNQIKEEIDSAFSQLPTTPLSLWDTKTIASNNPVHPHRQPEIISQDDLITLVVLEDRFEEAKKELDEYQQILVEALEKGLPIEEGRFKLKATGLKRVPSASEDDDEVEE